MAGQALYRKWRPQLWDEVVGQEHVVQTLRNALRGDRVAHAYLFAGPRGCGKTTTARLVAKAVNCLHPDPGQRPDNTCAHCTAVNEGRFLDLIEIDGASNNGVDNIRDLREKINFSPGEGRFKIYIIDEVHMLSAGAFNALLKTLEEPPPHAIFILATTEAYKIPATVASRCQRFEFRRIPVTEIVTRLKKLCAQENVAVEDAALEMVARQATGSLRDAISLLDQLISTDNSVTLAQAQALLGTAAGQTVQGVVDALTTGNAGAGLQLLAAAADAGTDPRQLARQLVDYLRGLMLVRLGSAALVEATADVRATMARQAQSLDTPAVLRAIRAFNAAANDVKGGWQPQLPLELAIVECTTPIVTAPALESAPETMVSAPSLVTAPARFAEPARGARPPASAVPAPPAAKSAESKPAGGVAAGVSADLKSGWTRVLALMKEKHKPVEPLLRSCTVVGLEGSTLRLVTSAKLVSDKLNDPATAKVVNDALSEVLGTPCSIKCELGAKSGARAADLNDIPADGMVATALRDLGGEIVE
jgi:DNA polymerase-3 subunit gamma/tau